MKPIVGNKAIESIDKMSCKEQSLSFASLSIEDIAKLSQSELEIHLTQVDSIVCMYGMVCMYCICMYVCMYVIPSHAILDAYMERHDSIASFSYVY